MEGVEKRLTSSLVLAETTGDVHTAGVVHLVKSQSLEDELLGYAHGEGTTAVEALSRDTTVVADTGIAAVIRRSRNSITRSPMKGNLAPIGILRRSLKVAIDLRCV